MNGDREVRKNCVVEEEQTCTAQGSTKFHIHPKSNAITSFDVWVRINPYIENEDGYYHKAIINEIANGMETMIANLEKIKVF